MAIATIEWKMLSQTRSTTTQQQMWYVDIDIHLLFETILKYSLLFRGIHIDPVPSF